MKLLKAADGDIRSAIYFAAFAGLRRGEICALDLSDIHNVYISVNKSMGIRQDCSWAKKPPKTDSSNRNVNIPDFLTEYLKINSQAKGQVVKATPDQITDRFRTVRKKAGVNCRFHDPRHYYASVNHALGVPDQYIMATGGWKTGRTMKAVYRNTLAPEKDKFAKISLSHFEQMQHG